MHDGEFIIDFLNEFPKDYDQHNVLSFWELAWSMRNVSMTTMTANFFLCSVIKILSLHSIEYPNHLIVFSNDDNLVESNKGRKSMHYEQKSIERLLAMFVSLHIWEIDTVIVWKDSILDIYDDRKSQRGS